MDFLRKRQWLSYRRKQNYFSRVEEIRSKIKIFLYVVKLISFYMSKYIEVKFK